MVARNGDLRGWLPSARVDKHIGAVVELNFGEFLCYALCTHKSWRYGHLLRLYTPKFTAPLSGVEELDSMGFRMSVYFPLAYAVKHPEVSILGKIDVPPSERKVPPMRSIGLFAPGGSASGWWIIQGKTRWHWWSIERDKERWVVTLSEEMSHYSPNGIHDLGAIREIYDQDLFPDSEYYFTYGPIDFEPRR